MNTARKLSAEPISSAQPILAHDGDKPFTLPAAEAWSRMQALHHHALLEAQTPYLGPRSRPKQRTYAKSLGSALGQFATSHPELRSSMFESLVHHVEKVGSMDGLASMYASGLTDAATRQTRLHERGSHTLKTVGWPNVADGGIEHAVRIDAPQGRTQGLPNRDVGPVIVQKKYHPPKGTVNEPSYNIGGKEFFVAGGSLTEVPGAGVTFGGSVPQFGPKTGDLGPLGDSLGSIVGGVGSNDPNRNDPNPTRTPLGNNPGGADYTLPTFGDKSPTSSELISFGGRLSGIAKNPGGKSINVGDMPKGSLGLAEETVDQSMTRLESGGGTLLDKHGHGLGPHGSGHVSLPSGRGGGDPGAGGGAQDPWDAGGWAAGVVAGAAIGIHRVSTRLGQAAANAAKNLTDSPGFASGVESEVTAEADAVAATAVVAAAPEEAEAALSLTIADGVLIVTSAFVGGILGEGAASAVKPAPPPPKKGGGGFGGPDEGTGSGSGGPRASSYMPAEDSGRSPIGPRSKGEFMSERTPAANFAEIMPAPDSSGGGGGAGPRAMRVARAMRVNGFDEFMPNPEGNSPVTPHS